MQQALHIFRKDVRRLRYPIALVLAATALFTYVDMRPWGRLPLNSVVPYAFNAKPLIVPSADTFITSSAFVVTVGGGGLGASSSEVSLLPGLLILAWCWLIALVVYADAIPGDRQFRLTRPYDRPSLWGAKAFFALAFVNLPLVIAQVVILRVDGFPILPNLSGLLWDHVLVTAIITMPAMALAALTRRMTHFVALFVVGGFAASVLAMLFMQMFFAGAVLPLSSSWYLEGSRLGPLNWVEDAVGTAAIAAFTIAVICRAMPLAGARDPLPRRLSMAARPRLVPRRHRSRGRVHRDDVLFAVSVRPAHQPGGQLLGESLSESIWRRHDRLAGTDRPRSDRRGSVERAAWRSGIWRSVVRGIADRRGS
jgi:hypothetical protein